MYSRHSTLLIFNFQRPCRHFPVNKTRPPRYYHITMAQVIHFPCWDSEQLPPVFCKLSPQPNVSDGSLLSWEATKLLVTSLGQGLDSSVPAKKIPHR